MDKQITVGDHIIGDGAPCFLMAEVGITCNGNLGMAKDLIDAAAEGGLDAIKFITTDAEAFLADRTMTYRYKTLHGWAEENMFEMSKTYSFSIDEWQEIENHAHARNLIFFSTADYLEGIEILEKYCHVPAYKISSWDVTYEPLIIRIARTGKTVMLDLGPGTFLEIVRCVELCRAYGSKDIVLLHDFHTEIPEQMNMRNIAFLKETFGLLTGFSSPGVESDLDIMAIALGAKVIEKRITLNRGNPGHHHVLSLEPHEIRPWIERIKYAERALGSWEIHPSDSDTRQRKEHFRSICATHDIRQGEPFSSDNLDGKRPGAGIPTAYIEIFYGRPAKRDIKIDTFLDWNDI